VSFRAVGECTQLQRQLVVSGRQWAWDEAWLDDPVPGWVISRGSRTLLRSPFVSFVSPSYSYIGPARSITPLVSAEEAGFSVWEKKFSSSHSVLVLWLLAS
jgi:hypothetical protein